VLLIKYPLSCDKSAYEFTQTISFDASDVDRLTVASHLLSAVTSEKSLAPLGDDESTYATQSMVKGLPASSTPESFK
jgi:hypothetical protein